MSRQQLSGLHQALLGLHGEARAIGQHQVGYHALAGAMHAAESMHDTGALEEIAALAREHAGWINQNDPKHPLSTESAAVRGHQSLFEQLAVMCGAVRARLRVEDLKRK